MRWHRWAGPFLIALLGLAADHAWPAELAKPDYLIPPVVQGSILDPQTSNLLFRVTRKATRTNNTVQVLREYSDPQGRIVARERAAYEGSQLVSCELDELQIGALGRAVIERDQGGKPRHIKFEYTGEGKAARTKTDREPYRGEVLINDMVPGFIQMHWDELAAGRELKIRFIVIPRRESVGFTFSKVGETSWNGQAVARVRMAPSSMVISALVDPIHFWVEKEKPHRVLAYSGRTVLKNKNGNDLEALTVFQHK